MSPSKLHPGICQRLCPAARLFRNTRWLVPVEASRLLLALGFFALMPGLRAAEPPGVDDHTTALWLFDEPTYPNVIPTDSSCLSGTGTCRLIRTVKVCTLEAGRA